LPLCLWGFERFFGFKGCIVNVKWLPGGWWLWSYGEPLFSLGLGHKLGVVPVQDLRAISGLMSG
jgi:hypothetical protein